MAIGVRRLRGYACRMRIIVLLFCIALSGCSVIERAGVRALARHTDLPPEQITRDIRYVSRSDSPKHRFDFFQPTGRYWPVLIFIHGGSWTSGDKSLSAGGEDIYGNIGRFYASRGIGVAVINYRLIPDVNWRTQLDDVAQAVRAVGTKVRQAGGDSSRIFLLGHSAGAHLAASVALNPALRAKHRVPRIAGVIGVSGAAYDMTDTETYRLGNQVSFYAERFAEDGANPDWQRNASAANYLSSAAPPFLLFYADGDSASLRRQSQHFHQIIQSKGLRSRIVRVPGESHILIVLTLTREDKVTVPAILDFVSRRGGIDNPVQKSARD